MSIWDYEWKRSRRASRPGILGWTRRVEFHDIPNASVESLIPAEHADFPGEGGKHGAKLMRSSWTEETEPNRARAILDYRPLTCEEWLEAHPNKGVLFGSAAVSSRRVRRTTDGYMLEGKDPDDETGRKSWEVTEGRNVQFYGQPIYEVYSVINDRDTFFFQFVSKVGTYNSTPMSTFPLAPIASKVGQWLLVGMSCVARPAASRLWTMRHRFLLHEEPESLGWSQSVIATQYEIEAVEVPVTDEDGNAAGTQITATLVPTGSTNTAHLLRATNFLAIEMMLVNSW